MIPKIIHQIWVGGPVPERFVDYIDSWRACNPDYEYRLWGDSNMPLLRNQGLYDTAEKHAPNNVGQFKADLARYELLHMFGGVYVDIDFEARKPLSDLPLEDETSLFAAWEVPGKWINNAILGAAKDNPFLDLLIRALPVSVAAHKGTKPNVMTGPQFFTKYVNMKEPPIVVYDKDLFYPYLYHELHRAYEKFPNAVAVHHWNNRRTNGR